MNKKKWTVRSLALAAVLWTAPVGGPAALAADVIPVKLATMELAADIARAAVAACREMGYQVTAVVVDRTGTPQVIMRDVLAPRFTIQLAQDKANAVVLTGISSAEFRNNRQDVRQEMNHIRGVLLLQGGLPVRVAGSLIAAVGVSGAAGGDKDEICAGKGIASVQERLDFAG